MSALISVYDKKAIPELANFLISKGIDILSTGGTYKNLLDNLDDEVTPLYAELFNGGGISQATYSSNPFTTTLTDGYYLHLYIEMPYDSDYTDGNPVAVRRIDMTQN